MADPLRQAERIKLARALHVPLERLDCLAPLDALELRALREQATRALFGQHKALFQKLAAAGKLLPAAINALISEKVFGPMLSARVAGLLPAGRAVDISRRLSIPFQAELCQSLDPRSAPELLRRMPVETIVAVARVLLARKEHVTMARFVDALAPEALRAVINDTRDDDALVRIGFYVEEPEHLSVVFKVMSDERLRGMVRSATLGPPDLQQAGAWVLSAVNDTQKGRMGDAAAALGDKVLKALIANLEREGADAALAAMLSHMKSPGPESNRP